MELEKIQNIISDYKNIFTYFTSRYLLLCLVIVDHAIKGRHLNVEKAISKADVKKTELKESVLYWLLYNELHHAELWNSKRKVD